MSLRAASSVGKWSSRLDRLADLSVQRFGVDDARDQVVAASTPYNSRRSAWMSRTDMPGPYIAMIRSSKPSKRPSYFGTICSSRLRWPSRGCSSRTLPCSVWTVFVVKPLRACRPRRAVPRLSLGLVPRPERSVEAAGGELEWTLELASTPVTSALNRVASLLPDRAWHSPSILAAMSRAAGLALRAGRVRLIGPRTERTALRRQSLRIRVAREVAPACKA